MSEWKTIDSAPKDGTEIDLWIVTSKEWRPEGESRRVTDCCWASVGDKQGWCDFADGCWDFVESNHHTVTHWMPIPEPPLPFARRPTGDET